MELICGRHNLLARHRGCVATIGNFDGVHLGHQAVLGQLRSRAEALELPELVITFEPQPAEYFAPDRAPARLTRLREKLQALAAQRVDRVLCLHFQRHLATQPAEAFIRQLLVEQLGVRHLVVGDDFRFGHRRLGDFALLCRAGKEHGFTVEDTHTYDLDGGRVSSTRVRQALARGDLELAARLLGRTYAMAGRVAHGDKLGRTLGFPTANIHLHRRVIPLTGVFAVTMHGVKDRPLPGMANIGRRPTVGGIREQLEVHLFDFHGDLYGCHVQVEFLHHLRPERRFDSLEALTLQIQEDAGRARAFFDHIAPGGDIRHG
ncbi:MAG: bifunctional riboflavin kinase/FAD synthetase [Candidatus Competibacteraceae bacterium]|nr:bifunctional riboflavin kinase/FAD synthetase [Candidatus Competibacteraceae bacterium]